MNIAILVHWTFKPRSAKLQAGFGWGFLSFSPSSSKLSQIQSSVTVIPFNRCEDADGAGEQTPHSCPQCKQKEDCLAVERSLHFTPTHQAARQLRSGMELKQDLTRQAAWPQECELPDTESFQVSQWCSQDRAPEQQCPRSRRSCIRWHERWRGKEVTLQHWFIRHHTHQQSAAAEASSAGGHTRGHCCTWSSGGPGGQQEARTQHVD